MNPLDTIIFNIRSNPQYAYDSDEFIKLYKNSNVKSSIVKKLLYTPKKSTKNYNDVMNGIVNAYKENLANKKKDYLDEILKSEIFHTIDGDLISSRIQHLRNHLKITPEHLNRALHQIPH